MHTLAVISIPLGPNIIDFGPFILAWHGLFTFIAVATSVYLAVRWGTKEGISADAIYSIAVWSIIGGIVGARVVHVIDFWGPIYQHDPIRMFYVWQGGIAIYGAILGGFAFGAAYVLIRNSDRFLALWGSLFKIFSFLGEPNKAPLPGIGHMADIVAPALLISMAIGRIGDIVNGEHFAKATDMFWGVIYTNSASPGYTRPASHPAVAYELIFDLLLAAAIWPLRNRLRPRGMFFVLYGGLYSIGRFFLSFLRVEQIPYFEFLNQAQIIALIIIVIAIPLVVFKAQFVKPSQN
ncbi:MAG: prolipoprotein diacylglyceryl transferase family protein [Chloroflexota bacterium]|nr:prolipoprotein diacylglyceryl transferase family protein [Chloroflexota bacterium]